MESIGQKVLIGVLIGVFVWMVTSWLSQKTVNGGARIKPINARDNALSAGAISFRG